MANPVLGLTDTRCCGLDLSSHNANPPGVFDGAPYELRDSSDDRDEGALASIRAFWKSSESVPPHKRGRRSE
jgi:hypothetical protein